MSADKSKENKKMSVGHNSCRQTKPKKIEICLPDFTFAGRHIQKAYYENILRKKGLRVVRSPFECPGIRIQSR